MNRKRIIGKLNGMFKAWLKEIRDDEVRKLVKRDAIITGGAIVSLLENEEPNDLDIYFSTFETAVAVAGHYVDRWNAHDHKAVARLVIDEEAKRVKVYIGNYGVAKEEERVEREPIMDGLSSLLGGGSKPKDEEPYRPVYLTDNAITLSDGIQLIIRFHGDVDEIHSNFDFEHCKMSYVPHTMKLTMPASSLEAVIMKELRYTGSKYPIASILRTRKFINRGYFINAGQYLKMIFQTQKLDLTNPDVLADQLNGVDLVYMAELISAVERAKFEDETIDHDYLVNIVEEIFDRDPEKETDLENE